jgi:membrane protein implicated in regulation of membrane protease activity
MPLAFLLPLAIALVTAWIAANSQFITAELTGIAAVTSLGISLIYAPWQVKLLLLIGIGITTKPLLLRPALPQTKTSDSKPQETRQYRGVCYQVTTTASDPSSSEKASHREAVDSTHQPTPLPQPEPKGLKYRGVSIPATVPPQADEAGTEAADQASVDPAHRSS